MTGHCDPDQQDLTHRQSEFADNNCLYCAAPENSEGTHQWVYADPDLPWELTMGDPMHLKQHVSLIAKCLVSFII
jgi:hypothetical protein